jgi:cytoskeleton protein RodZ
VPERLAPLAQQAITSPPPGAPPAAALPIPAPASLAAAVAEPPVPIPYAPTSAAASPVIPMLPAAPQTEPSRLTIRANADAWVLVKDRSGPVLLNRVLKSGEVWQVPPKSSLLLTTGNAGGTEILLDGAATAALGGSGAVRRDLPLDPDLVNDGRLAAPTSLPARPQQ